MAVPHTFEDFIRVHDRAIYDWLGGLLVDYSYQLPNQPTVVRKQQSIIRAFSSPQRAVAEVADLLIRQQSDLLEGVTDIDKYASGNNFPVQLLPAVTIDRPSRFTRDVSHTTVANSQRFCIDPVTGAYIIVREPIAYNVEYEVNFWMHKRYTEAYITEWIESQFGRIGLDNDERYINVTHRDPIGTTRQSLKLMSSADLSNLEGDTQRFIRFQYIFQLRAWLYQSTTTGSEEEYEDGTVSAVALYPVEFADYSQFVCVIDAEGNEITTEDPSAHLNLPNPSATVEGLNLFPPILSANRARASATVPTTGTAKFTLTGDGVFDMEGGTAGGTVTVLLRKSVRFDLNPGIALELGVYGIAYAYEASDDFDMNIEQSATGAGVFTSVRSWDNLRAGDEDVHVFTTITDEWFRLSFDLAPNATVTLSQFETYPTALSPVSLPTSLMSGVGTWDVDTKGRPALMFAVPDAPLTGSASITGTARVCDWADAPQGLCFLTSSIDSKIIAELTSSFVGKLGVIHYNGSYRSHTAEFDT